MVLYTERIPAHKNRRDLGGGGEDIKATPRNSFGVRVLGAKVRALILSLRPGVEGQVGAKTLGC